MRHGDHRGLSDIEVCYGDIFQINRVDPFGSGVDEIFAAIGDCMKPSESIVATSPLWNQLCVSIGAAFAPALSK
jgi:hypothetical protein